MKLTEAERAKLTATQWCDRVADSPIWRIMIDVSMFGREEFSECFGIIMDGWRDILEGICWAWSGTWRLLFMLALYAVYPISKPIMCAVYRKQFRDRRERRKHHEQSGFI